MFGTGSLSPKLHCGIGPKPPQRLHSKLITHTHTHTSTHAHTHARTHTYTHTHTRACTHAHTHAHMERERERERETELHRAFMKWIFICVGGLFNLSQE